MPNYVTNIFVIRGDYYEIDNLIAAVKGPESDFDFNKIVPMSESLDMISGTLTENAIMAYVTNNCEEELNPDTALLCMRAGVTNMFCQDYVGQVFERTKKAIAENGKDKTYDFSSSGNENKELTYFEAGKIYIDNFNACGYTNWYDWCVEYWGTKWNACDVNATRNSPTEVVFEFSTAWSTPFPIFMALTKMFPSLNMELSYADEDVGSNCGKLTWQNQMFGHWMPGVDNDGNVIDRDAAIRFACSVLDFDYDEFISELDVD